MKKIINYKKYDTETATEIGAWFHGTTGTFEYVHESLFRKNNGEYFLHGEGGAASKYHEKIGTNLWRGGSVIIPLTSDEAKVWCEEHMGDATYEEKEEFSIEK